MKKLLTIILTIATLVLAAIFTWHGEPVKAGGGDQTKIVYTCFTGNSSNGRNNLCVMNEDGSGKYQIPDPNNVIRDAFSPRFDVDAEKILFLSRVAISQGNLRHRLAIVNADGTNPLILFDGEQFDANDYSVNTLGFSPDGSKIAFVTYPRNGNALAKVLWIINRDGTGLTQLYAGDIYADFPLFTNGIQQTPGIQYISFSPDGNKIAVSINQNNNSYDAFLVNADGSGMTRLTDSADPVSSINPVFSSDGSKIVFTESAATGLSRPAIMNADGTNKIFLADGGQNFQASFSPDGSRIIYISTRNSGTPTAFFTYDIYVVNTDGTNEQRLTFNENSARSGLASFDPFGEKIVFNATPSGFQALEVYTMNPDGTSVTALTDSPGEENAGNPSYGNGDLDGDGVKNSLDNCRFVSNPSQVNTDGDAQGNACDADDDNDGIEDEFDNCALAANQYRYTFTTAVFTPANPEIYSQNFDGTNRIRLTNSSQNDFDPSFNRAGTQIVWDSNRSNRYEIYKMNADGSGTVRLTNIAGDNRLPTFSPDGSKIAFDSGRTAQRNVFIMNADGSNQTQITNITQSFNSATGPHFNHNGTRIAFNSERGAIGNVNRDIYSIKIDGTDEVRLTTATGKDQFPSYSPDGGKIVFVSFRDGDSLGGEIYTMNADGSNQTRLTNNNYAETEPTFTPDGSRIMFPSANGMMIMNANGQGAMPVTGGGSHPSFAPQSDNDGDGIGDVCDNAFDVNTPIGSNISVQAPNATVNFSNVSQTGITSFAPIVPNQNDLPQGYALCPTCPAYDVTTTAAYTPPITVCLGVPASVSQPLFLEMRLLHGEDGVLIDRTTNRFTDGNGQRFVCGSVNSLSPFILASNAAPTAAQVSVGGRVTANGRGVGKATVTLTDASGASRNALTNAFGFYRFDEVEVGQTYTVNVRHKRYEFSPRAVNAVDELTDVDFENTSQNRLPQAAGK